MGIFKDLSALVKATADKMEIQNRQAQQALRCQTCTLPYLCVQNVVMPVFTTFFGRQFVCEELYCDCSNCILRVALPEALAEHDAKLLQRRLERKMAQVIGRSFADVVRAKLVTVTLQYVLIRM